MRRFVLIGVTAASVLALYVVLQYQWDLDPALTPSPQTGSSIQNELDAIDTRDEVNSVLSDAGVNTIEEWMAHPECGPTDEFYGTYGISNTSTVFSGQHAEQLAKFAGEKMLNVDFYGARHDPPTENYSIKKDNWQIIVTYQADNSVALLINISNLQERPGDLLVSPSRCG